MKRGIMPYKRYRPYSPMQFFNRRWPDNVITKAPIWCSVDLRDGNQALSIPMNVDEKMELFELLVAMGFKEIEVGFPAASQVEYDFVRKLIEQMRIPDDVTIQVLTQAREDLIKRTFESLHGVKRAIVHLYNSTSTIQRKVVFSKTKSEIIKIATDGAYIMKALHTDSGNPGIGFEYSPESFTGTELDYALDICHAVIDVWEPTPHNKVIINLPATVEMSTPNIFADRIEWFIRHVQNRDSIIMSVHTHNDRGTAVAAAELAVMAGAERVEGSLFGNGERTGNMDIVTMALNLFSQGIDPELDLTNIGHIMSVYSKCTRMDVHARHPYAGKLVYTAFSGSHQDAINKGMKAQEQSGSTVWDVPYLPIDPKDVGRDYQSIIRINSQSGKGGIAYVMEKDWGFRIPKEMQPDFACLIQQRTERSGTELSSEEIYKCFQQEYLLKTHSYTLQSCTIHSDNTNEHITVVSAAIHMEDDVISFSAQGKGPIEAFVRGIQQEMKMAITVTMYAEHALSQGAHAKAAAYIGIKTDKGKSAFGVGIDKNISIASFKGILCALTRLANSD
ncbi:MAG: 2-isopropylmalate synthase [bacterium]